MSNFLQYIKEPWRTVVAFDRHVWNVVPDKLYLKCLYHCMMGKKLHLKNPTTYYEKLNWLKLYDRNPLYTTMVDKYAAKEYVGNIIGQEYIVPLYGVWNRVEEIDIAHLPDQFVLKCSHSSGDVVICKAKKTFDLEAAKKKLAKFMKRDLYRVSREWPYKNVPRRIIAEQYLQDEETKDLRDYKVYTFGGKAQIVLIASNRQSENEETYFDYVDPQYNRLEARSGDHPNSPVLPEKPRNFEKMIAFSERLSKGFPHIRVDFYEANGQLYFGELTLYDSGGFDRFDPPEWDNIFGDWLVLPERKGNHHS